MSDLEDYGEVALPPAPRRYSSRVTPRVEIVGQLTGRVISRLVYFDRPGLFGGSQIGLVTEAGPRIVIDAAPGEWFRGCPFSETLIATDFGKIAIPTRADLAEMHRGRHEIVGLDQGEPAQLHVEGQMILDVQWLKEKNRAGGETLRFHLTGPVTLTVHAAPPLDPETFTAGMELDEEHGGEKNYHFLGTGFRAPTP